MRLWHINLIKTHSIPKLQLLSQWRELNSIFKQQNKHILINFVYEYNEVDLYIYSSHVINEMKSRGINVKTFDGFNGYFECFLDKNVDINQDIFIDKMDDVYLRQCLYNLEEKYMCGQLDKVQWKKIYDIYNGKFELVE